MSQHLSHIKNTNCSWHSQRPVLGIDFHSGLQFWLFFSLHNICKSPYTQEVSSYSHTHTYTKWDNVGWHCGDTHAVAC